MKTKVTLLLAAMLAFLPTVAAQTGIAPAQIHAQAATAAAPVLIVCVNNRCMTAQLNGLVLDTSGQFPVLRVVVPPPVVVPPALEISKPTGPLASFTLAKAPAAWLVVLRNGLEQTEGEDYTVAGSMVTFMDNSVPQSGDIVKFRYQ